MTRPTVHVPTGGPASREQSVRRIIAAALVGAGALWITYGAFAMLRPWGDDVAYDEAVGYSLVRDTGLFVTYSLPGGLGLLLSAAGTIEMLRHLDERPSAARTLARRLAFAAVALGVVSVGGVVALVDPVFTASRIAGTLVLAAAVLVAARVARQGRAPMTWSVSLSVVGVLGAFLLPLWPLVYALRWMSEPAGACVIGLFGLGWVWLGWRLWHAGNGSSTTSRHEGRTA